MSTSSQGEPVGTTRKQPTMSRLLAGNRKSEAVVSEEYVGHEFPEDSFQEDSGIVEIRMADETTSPEETSSARTLNKPARKCKWCDNFARGASNLCARHGGGRRCHCGKLARGPTNLCMKHGGGRRCALPTCDSAAVYKSDYCRSHGGGKRCSVEGCVASVYSSKESLCFKHGGGIRCKYEDCSRAPVGRTEFCIRHGGGKRCAVDECFKGAVCEGLCMKHHQDAYKLESPTKTESPPASPLRMVSTTTITLKDEIIIDDAVKQEVI